MKIRKMKTSDIPAVIEIESETYENPISEKDLCKEIQNKNNGSTHPSLAPIVTCNDDGEVVGYLLFEKPLDVGVMVLVIVSTKKEFERQGIATGMMNYMKSKMKELRCISVEAHVHQDRVAAQCLLAKSGFSCTKTYDSEMNGKEFEVCQFSYSVPLDDLSDRHIAKIAKECRKANESK